MGTKFTQISNLFQQFRLIPTSQHFALIRFYQQRSAEIEQLPADEHLTILAYYVDALHQEGGQDELVIEAATELLQLSILNNIQFVDGEDIYLRSLYQKTVAYLRQNEVQSATHLARQLLHLAPQNKQFRYLLQDCLLLHRPAWVKTCFALGVLALAAAVALSVMGILLIETIYLQWAELAAGLETAAYVAAGLFLLTGLFGHYYFVQRQVRKEMGSKSK